MFLLAIRKKVGVTSTIVGKAVAKALIAKSDDASLKAVYIDGSFWAKRLFRRMGGGGVPSVHLLQEKWRSPTVLVKRHVTFLL